MKTKISVLIFVFCFAARTVCLASDLQMGTWHLNEAKSKFPSGMTRNKVVVYAPAGDQVKVTVDGIDAKGRPAHSEWIGKFDGKFYRVSGDPTSDARSYKKLDDRSMDLTVKKGPQVTTTGRINVAPDGKTRMVTTHRIDVNGKRFTTMALYEKK